MFETEFNGLRFHPAVVELNHERNLTMNFHQYSRDESFVFHPTHVAREGHTWCEACFTKRHWPGASNQCPAYHLPVSRKWNKGRVVVEVSDGGGKVEDGGS